MAFTITEYCDVSAKAQLLGLNAPEGLALLPRNFEHATTPEELLHENAVQTVRSLFRQNGILETKLEQQGQKIPCIKENQFALVLPSLFVGGLILSQNPHLLSVALSVIANYATEFFKGTTGRKKVVFDVIVEDKARKRSKKIHYEGELEGLKGITEIARKVFTNDETY